MVLVIAGAPGLTPSAKLVPGVFVQVPENSRAEALIIVKLNIAKNKITFFI